MATSGRKPPTKLNPRRKGRQADAGVPAMGTTIVIAEKIATVKAAINASTKRVRRVSAPTGAMTAAKSKAAVTPPVGKFVAVLGEQAAPSGGVYRVLTPAAPSRFSDEEIARAIKAARSRQ